MTRIIKLVISIFYFAYLKLGYLISNLLKLNNNNNCVTLYYHSIFDDEKSKFRKQIELLSKKTITISSDFFGELN